MISDSAPVSLRAKIVLALGTVYLVWGSTYLAIRWTVEELPPLLSGSMRFTVAGLGFLLLGTLGGFRTSREELGPAKPSLPHAMTRRQIKNAVLVGMLMPGLANALVCLAEQSVPSALTALILAVMPLWIALIQILRRGQARPGYRATAGLLVGFAGTAVLIWKDDSTQPLSMPGVLMLLAASLIWAIGSLFAREADRPTPWMASAGVEMLAGGMLQAVLGIGNGDLGRLLAASPGPRAIGSLVYLTVIGAWAGYGAFSWLTSRAPPTLVATYSYVNPLVAVLLGWSLASEPLGIRTLIAGAMIVCSVALVTTEHRQGA